jgi:hypothetical protein
MVEIAECNAPPLHCFDADLDILGQIAVDDLVPRTHCEKPDQHRELIELLDVGEIAHILAHELLGAQGLPPPGEARIASEEGLGIAAMPPQSGEGVLVGTAWWPHDGLDVWKIGGDGLCHRERVHVVDEVAPHKAVADATVRVEAARPGDDDADLIRVAVEEALQKLLPSGILMEFIEERHGRMLAQLVETEMVGHMTWTAEEDLAIVDIVPVEIGMGPVATRGGLPDLARPTDECHLAVGCQVLGEDGVVEAGDRGHLRHYSVDRKLVKTILRFTE